jgi:hypothetical protein
MRRHLALLCLVAAIGAATALFAAPASATVLCKTASNPCTSKYGAGTVVELTSTGYPVITIPLHIPNTCQNVLIKGEVTSAGGVGESVSGTVTAFGTPECEAPFYVPEKGKFSIKYTSGHNGTMVLEGFKIEETRSGCDFTGPFSIALTGGEMASGEPSSQLTRWPGFATCPEKATWDIKFTVIGPEPLYIEER